MRKICSFHNHPEMREGEMFLSNVEGGIPFKSMGWEGHRRTGVVAYTWKGKRDERRVPVFISREAFVRERGEAEVQDLEGMICSCEEVEMSPSVSILILMYLDEQLLRVALKIPDINKLPPDFIENYKEPQNEMFLLDLIPHKYCGEILEVIVIDDVFILED